jgi:hypothetical protein
MTSTNMPAVNTLTGHCDCRRIRASLRTRRSADACIPRACDCSFCSKHGAAWLSDPEGHLRIEAHTDDDLRRFRQGSETADMLLCAHCGVLMAVVFAHEDGLFGAVNAGCIDDAVLAAPVVVSPQRLSAAEKTERWRRLWARAEISPHHPSSAAVR